METQNNVISLKNVNKIYPMVLKLFLILILILKMASL